MRLVRIPSRETRDDHLIPLINVIFLMLIFFMIVGRIAPSEPLTVEPPISEQGREGDDQARVLLIGPDGGIALDGELITRAALGERIAAWVTETRDPTASRMTKLTLKADASVRAGALRETLDLLRAAGVERVSLVTARGLR
jgi:biopolymer transport protein ExbD